MRSLLLLPLLCAPSWSARDATPTVHVAIGSLQATLDPLAVPQPEKDAADFASFLVVNLNRRKACPRAALPALYDRLLPTLEKAAAEEPTRFHHLTALAPRFDEDRITGLFTALRDDPAGFAGYLRAHVRFLLATDNAAPPADKDAPPSDAAAEVSEVALREYRRYQMRCPVLWVQDEGAPPPPQACGYVSKDITGFIEKVAGESFTPSGR